MTAGQVVFMPLIFIVGTLGIVLLLWLIVLLSSWLGCKLARVGRALIRLGIDHG